MICCHDSKQSYKAESIGAYNQVTVVGDSLQYKQVIEPALMDSMVFGRPFEGLFFPPTSRLATRFYNPSLYNRHKNLRNVIIIQKGKPKIEFYYDSIAAPQTIVKIYGNKNLDYKSLISFYADSLTNTFVNTDKRYLNKLFVKNNIKQKPFLDSLGYQMLLPKSFDLIKTTTNFCWYREDVNEDILNTMFYVAPAIDSITTKHLIDMRNVFNKRHVESTKQGDYATTDTIVTPTINQLKQSAKEDVYEIRGNWSMVKEMMGGPFITRVIHNKEKQQLYFADCFIFAPNVDYYNSTKNKKRTYLLQIESFLSTFQKK